MFKIVIIFILAGLAEIGGGYLIWQWLERGKVCCLGTIWRNSINFIWCNSDIPNVPHPLVGFMLPMEGVFVFLSVLWGWGIDKKTPDVYDFLGAIICLIGVSVILFAPRQ